MLVVHPSLGIDNLLCTEASLHTDLDEMREYSTAIGGRYMGADQAEAFGERNAVHGEYLVRAKITKVIAYAALAD